MLRGLYWRLVTALKSDRGEGPVPYIIIVAVMALAAVAIAVGVSDVADGWLTRLEQVDTP
jgi:hypothetical protein